MASALASRMSRLAISVSKLATHRSAVASLTRSFDDSKLFNRSTVAVPSSAVALCAFDSVGARSLSSIASQRVYEQVTPGTEFSDFGATSSLPPLISQKQAENFAAFTYANRHQKGEMRLGV